MTAFIARLHSRALRREMDALEPRYASPPPPRERERTQLELLNRVWRDVRLHVSHYATLSRELGLPEQWESLEQFVELVPTSGRGTFQRQRERLVSTQRPPEKWIATGGSTAQPIQIPCWKSEVAATRPNQWLGRGWHGVAPGDRLFLLWGHSHLLGTGLRGWINAHRREVQDRLLGYLRFSAYDISDEAMQAALESILAFRPSYIVGYSVALDRLERAPTRRCREALWAPGRQLPKTEARIEVDPLDDQHNRLESSW